MNPEIFAKLQEAIQESLGVSKDKITMKARIIDDLGSDSLDLLDMLFVIEEKFGIKIKRKQIESMARDGIPEGEFDKEGMLTERGAERLRQVFPGADTTQIVTNMPLSRIPYLFTVETFYILVEKKLAERDSGENKPS